MDIIINYGDYEISDGVQAAQFGPFIKTKLYKLEGNKLFVKEQIEKSLIFIHCIGAPQKW